MKRQLLPSFPSGRWPTFAMTILFALSGSCTAEDPVLSSSTPFIKVKSFTSSYSTVNNCTLSAGGSNGTYFTFNIVYDASGSFTVSKMDGTYTWSDGTTGTTVFTFTDTPSAGGFRSVGRSGTLSVINHCIRFGSTTYIDYNIKITTTTQLQSSVVLRLTKPPGAN